MATWRDQWRASLPPADEPLASPPTKVHAPLSGEALTIPPPSLEVHREQVIEDDSVVRADESDRNGDDVEQIDNPNNVLDHQEE